MTCCRHLVDDHTPAGCVWCACRVTREEHDDHGEVDGLEDWRRAGGSLAEWTLSAAWLTAPADASRPGPVSGVIDRARVSGRAPDQESARSAALAAVRSQAYEPDRRSP